MEMTKKASRAAYMREYRKKHPARVKRVWITLSLSEYADLRERAGQHGIPVGAFVKSATHGYISGNKVPSKRIEDGLSDLVGQLRRIGNNINQIGHYANAWKKLTWSQSTDLKAHLHELEEKVIAFIGLPRP